MSNKEKEVRPEEYFRTPEQIITEFPDAKFAAMEVLAYHNLMEKYKNSEVSKVNLQGRLHQLGVNKNEAIEWLDATLHSLYIDEKERREMLSKILEHLNKQAN